MALTVIDDNAVLIVLDLQVATAGMPTTPNAATDIFQRSSGLAKAFRDKGLPVVWVNVAGGSSSRVEDAPQMGELPENWTDLPEELGVHAVGQDVQQARVGRVPRRPHGGPAQGGRCGPGLPDRPDHQPGRGVDGTVGP